MIQPITIAALNAGSSQTVNVAPYLQSPLSSPQCAVSSVVTVRSGTGVTGSGSGCSVTVNAAKDARGAATLVFEASDGPGRRANGEIRVTLRGAPDAPQRVSATADRVAGGLARVSWSPPANDGGLPVLQYEVRANTGATLICPASPCTVSGLKNGVPVSFTVRARNAVDWSAPSAPSQEVTPDTAPRAVSVGTVTPGDRTLAVSWSAPVNEGSAVDQYQVQWVNTSGGAGGGTRVVAGGTLTTTLSGLVNNNQYSIRVQAHNGAGWGPYGPAVVKQSVGTPAAVAAPRLTPRTPNANDSRGPGDHHLGTTDPNGPPITTYTVFRRVGGGAWASIGTVSGTATRTVSDTMNYDGRTYEYTVTATNGGGKESPKSNASPYRATGIPAVPSITASTNGSFDATARITVQLTDSRASSFTSVKWRSSAGETGTWPCGGCADGSAKAFSTTKLDTKTQTISVSACNDATPVQCSAFSGGSQVEPYGQTQPSRVSSRPSAAAAATTRSRGRGTTSPTAATTRASGSVATSTATSGAVRRVSRSAGSTTSRRSPSPSCPPSPSTARATPGAARSDSATTPDKPPIIVTVSPSSDTCGAATGRSCPTPGSATPPATSSRCGSRTPPATGTATSAAPAPAAIFADKTIAADGNTHQTTAYYGGHGGTLDRHLSHRAATRSPTATPTGPSSRKDQT